MAHHKSTITRIRQTKKRTERQTRYYRTRLQNISKAVRKAVEENNREEALRRLQWLIREFSNG